MIDMITDSLAYFLIREKTSAYRTDERNWHPYFFGVFAQSEYTG